MLEDIILLMDFSLTNNIRITKKQLSWKIFALMNYDNYFLRVNADVAKQLNEWIHGHTLSV